MDDINLDMTSLGTKGKSCNNSILSDDDDGGEEEKIAVVLLLDAAGTFNEAEYFESSTTWDQDDGPGPAAGIHE